MVVPAHVAIIMDGNGRWAKQRGLSRVEGHKAGVSAMKRITRIAGELGIAYLTVYAFSTENWKRPDREVNFIMRLFRKTLLSQAQELHENNVRVKVIGRRDNLSSEIIKAIKQIEKLTEKNSGLELNIAFNYGGRAEIIDLIKKLSKKLYKEGLSPETLHERDIEKYLYNPSCPEVELLIRTGGERRLSNFLLWQNAYSELYFTDKYWPDFNKEEFMKALNYFETRDRRFGGLNQI